MTTRPTQTPWSEIAIEIADMTTRSKKGNSHIVVIQDLSTKYVELFPTHDKKSKTTVKILESTFDRWGTPQSLISNNETEYCNREVSSLLRARGVKHHTSPLSHTQANRVERVNRKIKPMIAAFIKNHQNEWDINLSKFQLAYNTVSHAGPQISPFYLNHGREAVVKRELRTSEDKLPLDEAQKSWVDRMSKIDEFRYKIEMFLKKKNDERLARENKNKSIQVEIKVGSEVFYQNNKISNKAENYNTQLAHRYLGPVVVNKLLGPMTVEFVDRHGKKVVKYYVTDLKIPRHSFRRRKFPSTDQTTLNIMGDNADKATLDQQLQSGGQPVDKVLELNDKGLRGDEAMSG
ncbi:uncharacterized protein K02A2.6-like [Diachasma alloeum]|uniref:uncharacterized protein K02A2.6-like n=1 Tax=Diachasma alloeum TaxID=454923 RepID=UPI00073817F8|nr:uncharacterized protein K02A2.6-like [Diachasma alloeum]